MQSNFAIALIIFLLTYSAIIYSNVKNKGYPIWLIMGIGALAMVLSGVLRVDEAYSSINLRVIVFLFSMLVFASALEISGAIEMFATYMLSRARTPNMILLMILLGIGLLSSILMNDTLALIGTPLVIELSKKMKISPKPLLITLAFSVTIGSVMTPIGNPQNLLIAIESGIKAPFIFFLYFLAVPTILNIFLTYFLISKYFSNYMKEAKTNFRQVIEFDVKTMKLKDEKLAKLSIATLVFTILFILVVNTLELLGISFEFQISEISLIGALILLALSNKRRELILRLDWSVLLLFASLFVLIQGVWNGGVIAFFASYLPDLNPNNSLSILNILLQSTLLSQFMSNVPMVTLYLPLMKHLGFEPSNVNAWIALAAGSTIAGNLTLIGAASNLIICEAAETRGFRLGFTEFLKIGLPVTIMNLLILYPFLVLL